MEDVVEEIVMDMLREETEWSASTATLPLEQTSPRSFADEEEEEEEEEKMWTRRGTKSLRTLLHEMECADKNAVRPEEAEEEAEEEEEEQRSALQAELRHAEERVRSLEARLLDAEETIHHLKAEKLEAWRRVERLSSRGRSGAQDQEAEEGDREEGSSAAAEEVVRLRSAVYELEGQLRDAQLQRTTAAEEHMAVIREQEREIFELKRRLTAEAERADAAEEDTQHREEEDEEEEDEEDLTPSGLSGGADGWIEELVRPPTPSFDLDSPEVQYLLYQWTTSKPKLQYLRSWLTQVALVRVRDLPLDFPMGVELPRLIREIKDGFLVLVVPLLRVQPWREVVVHARAHADGERWDLRIRVEPRRRG